MRNRSAAILGAVALAIAPAAFAGTALAGNGHGNTNGNGQGNAQANSQSTAAADSGSTATASPGNSGNAPGHNKSTSGGGSAHSSASVSASVSVGVKPSSATNSHMPTFAAAGSNQTKLYGNGQTAGQIAMQSGASASAMLYGPGNSQPHKYNCGPHYVDVHALKAHLGKCGSSSSTTVGTTSHTTPVRHGGATSMPAVSTPAATPQASASAAQTGGVLGVTATARGTSKPFGGVLGAVASVSGQTLPFTGFPLWIAVVVAVALIVTGLALVRRGRTATI